MTSPSVPQYFDRKAVRRQRNRAAASLADHDFLFRWTMENIAGRLSDIRRQFPLALQIGGRGSLPDSAKKSSGIANLIVMDLAEKTPGIVLAADEEALPFAPATFDLVISPLALHTVNDLPGALVQIRRILKPDGLFLGALPGGETLHELRASLMQAEISGKGGVSPRVAPFADRQQMGALMQRAGFALPVIDSDKVTATYENAFRLMADLRGMGETNAVTARNRDTPGKALFAETGRLYAEKFAEDDGRLPATFEIIFLSGWSPHESQQKPLRPGSARQRLADALNTEETGTGIRPGE